MGGGGRPLARASRASCPRCHFVSRWSSSSTVSLLRFFRLGNSKTRLEVHAKEDSSRRDLVRSVHGAPVTPDGFLGAAPLACRPHRRTGRITDSLDPKKRKSPGGEDCEGLETSASNGDGALYHWCLTVLDRALAAKDEEQLVGLSYGIATWDDWAHRLHILCHCWYTVSLSPRTCSSC